MLSIAGFDPSGGAGILADIKTLEQCQCYGLGVITANTFQTHDKFDSIDWLPVESILNQTKLMLESYPVKVMKIGLIPDFGMLKQIRLLAEENGNPRIVLDPILKSSSGFGFHKTLNEELLKQVDLITPNWKEIQALSDEANPLKTAKNWSQYCSVLLKGGHSDDALAIDHLFYNENHQTFTNERLENIEKHGSGCILSSAIAGYLALGLELKESCSFAKEYTLKRLISNESLLAYHNN